MTFQTLLVEDDNQLVTITVNRPTALNALSELVLGELRTLLTELKHREFSTLRGVILTGSGERAFIAGADIREMSAMTPDEGEAFGALGQQVTQLLAELPVPVIACVNGYALGGGCEIAMGCDYVYATATAVFGQPEVALGLIPGFGGCVRLHRYVGPGHARELIYTGRKIDAAHALQIGLVNRVFDTKQQMLDAAAASIAESTANSSVAIALCKATINASIGRTITDGLATERAAFRDAFTSEDMREGTRAFIAKRPAVFPSTDPNNAGVVAHTQTST